MRVPSDVCPRPMDAGVSSVRDSEDRRRSAWGETAMVNDRCIVVVASQLAWGEWGWAGGEEG